MQEREGSVDEVKILRQRADWYLDRACKSQERDTFEHLFDLAAKCWQAAAERECAMGTKPDLQNPLGWAPAQEAAE